MSVREDAVEEKVSVLASVQKLMKCAMKCTY